VTNPRLRMAYELPVTLAVTLANLGDGFNRMSSVYSNLSALAEDVLVDLDIALASAPPGSGTLTVYVAPLLSDTLAAGGVSNPGDKAWAGRLADLFVLASVANAAPATRIALGSRSVAEACGGTVPARWCLVVANRTGVALAASGHVVQTRSVWREVLA
jgi:hypothetical protein